MTQSHDDTANLVAFRISPELMEQAQAALRAVREDPSDEDRLGALVEVILELTDRGMDFYYMEPLRRAQVGAITASAARLGLAAASRGIPAIIRRVVSSLDEEQVLSIAGFVDEILIREGEGP